MTTFHVWLTGQDTPEVVRAHVVGACDGVLRFFDVLPSHTLAEVRTIQPEDWHKWAVVADEADHVHI